MSWSLLKTYLRRRSHGPPIRAVSSISDREAFRDYVVANGCYDHEENLRIFEATWSRGPRYIIQALIQKLNFGETPVCDAGCGFGDNLLYCHPDSYGIELEPYYYEFAQSLGLNVKVKDIVVDDLSDLPQVPIVLCTDVLEHLDSPHVALRKLHGLLAPDGLIVVAVPTIPPLPWLNKIPALAKLSHGYQHSDHVNAFTFETVRFFCERAGFETISVSPLLPIEWLDRVPIFNKLFGHAIYIGRKLDGWDYPRRASREAALNEKGYRYRGQPWGRLGR